MAQFQRALFALLFLAPGRTIPTSGLPGARSLPFSTPRATPVNHSLPGAPWSTNRAQIDMEIRVYCFAFTGNSLAERPLVPYAARQLSHCDGSNIFTSRAVENITWNSDMNQKRQSVGDGSLIWVTQARVVKGSNMVGLRAVWELLLGPRPQPRNNTNPYWRETFRSPIQKYNWIVNTEVVSAMYLVQS